MTRRIEDLRSQLEATNVEIENAKRARETAEQELKGSEVELSLNKTSVQTLEVLFLLLFLLHLTFTIALPYIKCSFFFLNLIYPLQIRISVLQSEIATTGSELESLKVLS